MAKEMVAEAGFYGGKFLKPGATYEASEVAVAANGDDNPDRLDKMSKAELVAEAERLGVEFSLALTKAEMITAIRARG